MGRKSRRGKARQSEGRDVRYTLLGARLRALRERLGVTQEQLAEKAGCARPTIIDFELGRSNPSIELVLDLIEALGMDSLTIGWVIRPDELQSDSHVVAGQERTAPHPEAQAEP